MGAENTKHSPKFSDPNRQLLRFSFSDSVGKKLGPKIGRFDVVWRLYEIS